MEEQNQIRWPGWTTGSRIGKGGFGSVYEIFRDEYGIQEKAALKVISIPQSEDEIDYLRGEGLDDESITTQFYGHVNDIVREYKMMLGLKNCPNVVHCDDYMVVKYNDGLGWDIFLKMELLTPLLKALDQVNTERQIIKLGQDLCNALITCQKKNILHRDIKPQNIFMDEDGNFKLGDFGIARTAAKTTRATVGIGTYNFMAPEVMNNQPYGPAADIYSLGLVLYWLLNQRRGPFLPLPPEPYTSSMDEEARQRRFGGELLPAPVNGSLELQRVVLKACDFEPKKRYANALEMKRDLDAIFGNVRAEDSDVGTTGQSKCDSRDTVLEDRREGKTVRDTDSGRGGARKPKMPKKWLLPAAAAVLLAGALLGTGLSGTGDRGGKPAGEPEGTQMKFQAVPEAAMTELAPETTMPAPTVMQTEPVQIEAPVVPETMAAPAMLPERTYAAVDAGLDHTVVLYNDGTVEAIGSNSYGQCNVENWTDIIQISTLKNHTVGLKSDGTVVAVGDNGDGQCNVGDWTDIVAVSAGEHHTVGLKSNGTVVAVGRNQSGECDVQGWSGIISIGAAYTNTFGLCSDGTVIVSGSYRKGKIPGWEGIEAISVSDAHVVGLCSDGTVKAVGNNNHKQCDLSEWKNIVAVSAGCAYTTGLRADGTVLVQGINDVGQYGAKQWTDIAYIATGLEHTIGIKTDGTFLAVGANDNGQCNVDRFCE